MAIVRVVRLTSAKHGSTDIPGAISFEYSHEANVAEGYSDGDIGPTSVDVRGWNTRGTLTVDDETMAATLSALANSSAVIGYNAPGGSGKTLTFTSVSWGEVSEIEIPAGDQSGPTTRYGVGVEMVYGSANTKPSDIMAFA